MRPGALTRTGHYTCFSKCDLFPPGKHRWRPTNNGEARSRSLADQHYPPGFHTSTKPWEPGGVFPEAIPALFIEI